MKQHEAWGILEKNNNLTEEEIFDLECVIAESPIRSYRYGKEVLKGRFELGEGAIATDAQVSYLYARDVLKGRFLLGETPISKSPHYSFMYSRYAYSPKSKYAI